MTDDEKTLKRMDELQAETRRLLRQVNTIWTSAAALAALGAIAWLLAYFEMIS